MPEKREESPGSGSRPLRCTLAGLIGKTDQRPCDWVERGVEVRQDMCQTRGRTFILHVKRRQWKALCALGSQLLDLLACNDLGITMLRLALSLVVTRRTCDVGHGAEVEQGGQEQRPRLGWAAT